MRGFAWVAAGAVSVALVTGCAEDDDPALAAEAQEPAVSATVPSTTVPPVVSTSSVPVSRVGVVDLPVGVLGPVSSVAVDPESVGVAWDGRTYVVPGGFVWDESVDGGFLLFDRGRVLIDGDGVSISGAVFDSVVAGNSQVVAPAAGVGAFSLRQFRVVGGSGSSAVGASIGRGNGARISNFEIVGFDGDGLKPPEGSVVSDGFVQLVYRPGSELHYDGVQVTGRSGVTLERLRFRLEGDDNLNAAVFVHGGPRGEVASGTVIRDITVEHAPYSWYPIRLMSGSVEMRDVVGSGPVSADGRRPAAFVLHRGQAGIDWSSVFVDFDGDVDRDRSPR